MTEYTDLQVQDDDGVRTVTLNRPELRNAMRAETLDQLSAVFADCQARNDLRAVVVRGAGGHFCAGADLKGLMADGGKSADPVAVVNRRFGALLQQAESLPQVLVTVCEGAVLGGGFGLVCVSDIALAHEAARFGLPETTRGLPPAQIAPYVVTRIGLTQARRLALTGASFRGHEAQRLGVVHEVFDTVAALDDGLAATLTAVRACAPGANAVTKAILLGVGAKPMGEVLDDAARRFAECARGPEAAEGIAAFLQKRPAAWAQARPAGAPASAPDHQ